jgi:zinc transport system substrate-binding protein
MRKTSIFLFLLISCALSATYLQNLNGQDSGLSANSPDQSTEEGTGSQSPSNSSQKLKILSSFYPIHEFVKKVGGDKIDSQILIPPGIEPHDYEPSINQIRAANAADALVYNGLGFESWIDKININYKIDASSGLNVSYTNNGTKFVDPHIWLDPVLVKKVIENIRDALVKIDPNNRITYFQNSMSFLTELDILDKKIRAELASCKKRDFVAFHNAFSYFAERYGLKQHIISSAGPEEEIKPQRLAEIIQIAKNLDLHVIYSEELIDQRYASAVVQDIPAAKVLVLSPIEGITKDEQESGIGYIDKMNENIQNLKIGLECNQ